MRKCLQAALLVAIGSSSSSAAIELSVVPGWDPKSPNDYSGLKFTGSSGNGTSWAANEQQTPALVSLSGSTGSGPIRGSIAMQITSSSLGFNSFGESFQVRVLGSMSAIIEAGASNSFGVNVSAFGGLGVVVPNSLYQITISENSTSTDGAAPVHSIRDAGNALLTSGATVTNQTLRLSSSGFAALPGGGDPQKADRASTDTFDYTVSFIAIPAPASIVLVGGGLLGGFRRRR